MRVLLSAVIVLRRIVRSNSLAKPPVRWAHEIWINLFRRLEIKTNSAALFVDGDGAVMDFRHAAKPRLNGGETL